MITQAWLWHFEKADGTTVTDPVSPAFTNQFDAEYWLGAHWRNLVRDHIGNAKLMHAGQQATATLNLAESMRHAASDR